MNGLSGEPMVVDHVLVFPARCLVAGCVVLVATTQYRKTLQVVAAAEAVDCVPFLQPSHQAASLTKMHTLCELCIYALCSLCVTLFPTFDECVETYILSYTYNVRKSVTKSGLIASGVRPHLAHRLRACQVSNSH